MQLHFNDWKLQTKSIRLKQEKKQEVTYSTPDEIPTDLLLLETSDELKINPLRIVVKDQNMVTSDTVIGSVEVSLRKLLTSPTLGKDQVIVAKIKEPKRGRIVGRVALTARIEPHEIPKQTLLGNILTHSLTHSLTNWLTHWLTHSLTYSPTHWLTHSLTHVGTDVVYGYMDIVSCDITGFKYNSGVSGVFSKPKVVLDLGLYLYSLTYSLTYSLIHLRRYWYSLATEINTC